MHSSNNSYIPDRAPKAPLNALLFGQPYKIANQSNLNSIILKHIDLSLGNTLYLGHHNLHSLNLCNSNSDIQKYLSSVDYLWIDGMPIIWMLQLLGYEINRNWRLTFLDWEKTIFVMADKRKWNVFLLGATKENINDAHLALSRLYPNANIKSHHGYLNGRRSNEINQNVLRSINTFNTDLLLVGMGMPTQERWISMNSESLTAKVVLPIGGYFDYIAGKTYTPPRWAGKIGLEWFFRLVSDPIRLCYRYLIEPWPVLFKFTKELIRHKFYQ